MSNGTTIPTGGGAMSWALIVAQLILTYGVDGAIKIYQVLNKDNFTVADLDTLRGLVRLPESY